MRKNVLALVLLIFLMCTASILSNDTAQFARYPAPSPDGSQLAFSYHGDIWVVPTEGGRAMRLTVHEAYDHHPVWSPDGSMIAFSSDRFGNDDVFVMKSTGGNAKRLTFLSVADLVTDWTSDGKNVIFTSNRDYSLSGATRVPYVYTIPVIGGEPKNIMNEAGNEATFSPDGKSLAFCTHSRRAWGRIGYRGKSNNDIWIWNSEADTYSRVTDFLGSDSTPMWNADGSAMFFLSEQNDFYNIWKFDVASGEKTQVTNHSDHVRFPGISRDGSVIVYELEMDLFALNTASGQSSKLNIDAPSESKFNTVEKRRFSNQASEMAISPDESEIAFIVRGEIFVMKEKGGTANQVTETPARELHVIWDKEGTALYFASDRDGDYDLYKVESDDPDQKKLSKALAFKTTKVVATDTRITGPDLSPDGKLLAYVENEVKLHIITLENNEDKVLLDGWNLGGFQWSPDSKWIAFSRDDREFNSDIWIIPAAGGQEVNVTKHPDNEGSPAWSADGKKLAFISRRLDDNNDVWYVYLQKADDEKTAEDWEDEEEAKKAKKDTPPKKEEPAKKDEKKSDEEKPKKPEKPELEVKIDFEDINLRLRRVISIAGAEFSVAIAPDSKSLAITSTNSGDPELYTVKFDGTGLKQLTRGDTSPFRVLFNKKGNMIYYIRRGGMIQSVSLAGKVTMHGFQARMSIDHPMERMQKYEESWRTLNRLFYDGKFHGADWPAIREKFRPYAKAALEDRDFADVVNMIFGHLNGSHLGYRGGFGGDQRDSSGLLGLTFDPDYTGNGLKVASVLKDSPCDKEASRIKPGQILLAIDGTPVSWTKNSNQLLIDSVGNKVVLTVADEGDLEKTSRIIVRPTTTFAYSQLMYERFVNETRKKVHELSNNRIGYHHIQSMGGPSLERFEMELYSEAFDKDAIVIDVRNNGGGYTTDLMLAMLQVKDHAWTQARGSSVKGYPQDRRVFYAWTKPIIVLCNEYSYSNAEIFSWAIQSLKRGKVVGMQTSGAVISTGGYGLIDGSYVRTPFRGWYVIGSDINQEHNGCIPDITVEYMPGDNGKDIDRQLEVAVKELLKEIQ